MKKKPTKHYWEEDFCLGIPSWCPCSDCASFLLDSSHRLEAGSVETHCSKSSKQKWIEGCEAVKTTQQECDNNQTISDNIKKPEIEAGKENIDDHFPFDTTIDELEKLMEGECLANTAKNTDWVYKNFKSWRITRNKRFPKARCPDDVFSSKEVAWQWLCKYITETRKADGSEYTPLSLYLLLSGIQQYVCKVYSKMQINLFVDHEFTPLKNLCDSVFRKLHSKGIGASLKTTAVYTNKQQYW